MTISDNFNAANSSTLGNQLAWTDIEGDFKNANNAAQPTNHTEVTSSRANTALSTEDQEVSADITNLSTAGASTNDQAGVCARFSNSAATYYMARVVRTSSDAIYLDKVSAGTAANLSNSGITLGALPKTLKLRVAASGGNAVLTAFIDGVEVATYTDSSSPITGNTKTGLYAYHGQLGDSYVELDNFSASDYSSGATAFTLSGPSAGPANAASSNFTVTPNGLTTGTFTPTAIGGVSYSPSTLSWSNESSGKTFTINKTTAGAISVNGTFSNGLTPPGSVAYTAKATTTRPYTVDGGVAGSTTVAYTIKNDDATAFSARTTSGITDQGGGTFSAAAVTVPTDLAGIIQWDDNSAVFASEVLNNRTSLFIGGAAMTGGFGNG